MVEEEEPALGALVEALLGENMAHDRRPCTAARKLRCPFGLEGRLVRRRLEPLAQQHVLLE